MVSTTRPPGRPRSEATRAAILAAASDLLETIPLSQITIERIASEAKVGKQSIYRWWDGKADVLLDAFTDRALIQLPALEPTSNATADLECLLRLFFDSLRVYAIGKTLRGLIAEAQLDAEFRAKFYAVFVSARRDMMRDVVHAGLQSGEFRSDLEVELILDLLYGAFWYRLLSGTADPLDDAFAEAVIRILKPVVAAR